MALATGLQFDYVPLAAGAPARWDDVLGVATFDCGATVCRRHSPSRTSHACARIQRLRDLADRPTHRVRTATHEFSFGAAEDLLFGCISLTEASGLHCRHGSRPIARYSRRSTSWVIPIWRGIWNYLPQINVETDGLERYRQFNSARRNALIAYRRDLTGNVPAACALGSITGSPLVFISWRADRP